MPMIFVTIAVCLKSKVLSLNWSEHLARNNDTFTIPKFCSKREVKPALATNLMADVYPHLKPIGSFLSKTSLAEVPQLCSILKGNMSFVGEHPACFNQQDLINWSTAHGVHVLVQGLTGSAKVNCSNELPIPDDEKLDVVYLEGDSLCFTVAICGRSL